MPIKRAASCNFCLFRGTFALLALSSLCQAVLVNRTIDSEFGDVATGFVPVYHSPQLAWADQTCGGCYIQPDPARAFDGTWMAATYHPELQNINFTLQFTGVAIWVYFILSNANGHGNGTTTNTQCNFTLDGQLVGNFSHDPDMSTFDLLYNVTVFSQTGLANTSHELLISVNDYPISTFVNFDWAMYTTDVGASASANTTTSPHTGSPATGGSTTTTTATTSQNTTTSSSSQKSSSVVGIVVGAVLGGLALVAAIIAFIILRRRRRHRQDRTSPQDTGPFEIDAPYISPITDTTTTTSTPFRPSTSENLYQRPSFSTLPSSQRDPASTPGGSSGGGKASAMRQADVNDRILSAQREINYLMSLQSTSPPSGASSTSSPSQQEVATLRYQIEELRNQITDLQSQQHLNSTNDQPPAYS